MTEKKDSSNVDTIIGEKIGAAISAGISGASAGVLIGGALAGIVGSIAGALVVGVANMSLNAFSSNPDDNENP